MAERKYAAIDLKSFYASVECHERGLDPLKTNLVVADETRTEKTICLAVTPALKSYGIPGRARLFEVIQAVDRINAKRIRNAPDKCFTGGSTDAEELKNNPALKLEFIIAKPRMSYYMDYSAYIFKLYAGFVSSEDMHVYSVDEVFIDLTGYLHTYGLTASQLVNRMINTVFEKTGITATAGIGTNLYLCKIAMDIVAKHIPPDRNGARIAELDEQTYRKFLWGHKPITDFWRIGQGYAEKLAEYGMFTMGDVARCSIGDKNSRLNGELLYELFGVNAEILIDHAWGIEKCGIKDIKAYKPENSSLSNGQVLSTPYDFEKGKLIVREMTDALALALVEKNMVTDQLVLTVGYDNSCLNDQEIARLYKGKTETDRYGRKVPKSAHGSINLPFFTSGGSIMLQYISELYTRIVDRHLQVRRMYVVANHIKKESEEKKVIQEQIDLFTDYDKLLSERKATEAKLEKEKKRQQTVLDIRKRFGKNAILLGMNYEEGATGKDRNKQIGGHRA